MDATAFETALSNFLVAAQALIDVSVLGHVTRPTLTVMRGQRYVRIVRSSGPHDVSSHCFIDTTNGDILKCASWKAPAKGARGNIFNTNPAQGMTAYGAAYR